MFRLITAASAATATLFASAAFAQDFRALAEQDLAAAHAALRDNHPAAVTPGAGGEAFRSWIDAGLADARGRLGQVGSGDSHAYLMRYYAAGFRDANISIRPTFQTPPPWFATGWTGVSTGWRNGQYVVTYVQRGVRGAPPVGAVVKSCNLQPIEDWARNKLDRWEGDLNTEAGRVLTAPYLLWNRNNPFATGAPSVCEFQVGRRTREYTLRIQPAVAADMEAAYRSAVYVPSTGLAVEQVDGRPWVHMHTLADDADWAGFFAQVENQLPALRSNGFVLDLRGARGISPNGTSRGYGLANRIWTPEFTVSRQPPAGEITYRATQGNRQWFVDTLGRMQADPRFVQESGPVIEQTQAIVAAFDAALAAGQASFTMPGRPSVPDTGEANPVNGQIIVLIDAGCSGGCLDTLDLLTRLPNVRLAGSTTANDSIFIEQTVMRLPSNYADLSYGHKAWVSRSRGAEPYTPSQGLTYAGDPTDETAVRAWVASLFQ